MLWVYLEIVFFIKIEFSKISLIRKNEWLFKVRIKDGYLVIDKEEIKEKYFKFYFNRFENLNEKCFKILFFRVI